MLDLVIEGCIQWFNAYADLLTFMVGNISTDHYQRFRVPYLTSITFEVIEVGLQYTPEFPLYAQRNPLSPPVRCLMYDLVKVYISSGWFVPRTCGVDYDLFLQTLTDIARVLESSCGRYGWDCTRQCELNAHASIANLDLVEVLTEEDRNVVQFLKRESTCLLSLMVAPDRDYTAPVGYTEWANVPFG